MKITSDLFQAFLKCPTKCWLRASSEPGSGNTYAVWVKSQAASYVATQRTRLLSESPKDESAVSPAFENFKGGEWRLAFGMVDGVPWHNNNAEHAIKAFARLRDVIAGSSTEKGLEEYLTLLSVCQTCKYMGLDFLDFLRSGEKDIHAFADTRRRRRPRSASNDATTIKSAAAGIETDSSG